MARAISICIVLIFCFLGTLARAAPEKKNLVDSFADSAFILTGQCFDAESCKKDCQKGPGPPDPECVKKCETPPCEPNDKKCLDGVCDQRCHNEAEYNQPGIVSEYNQPEIPTYAKQLSGECNRGGTGRCGCFVRLASTSSFLISVESVYCQLWIWCQREALTKCLTRPEPSKPARRLLTVTSVVHSKGVIQRHSCPETRTICATAPKPARKITRVGVAAAAATVADECLRSDLPALSCGSLVCCTLQPNVFYDLRMNEVTMLRL
ncbi:hypothetical protein IWZ00DRAFT_374748 [Phyllosticta capitalensis]